MSRRQTPSRLESVDPPFRTHRLRELQSSTPRVVGLPKPCAHCKGFGIVPGPSLKGHREVVHLMRHLGACNCRHRIRTNRWNLVDVTRSWKGVFDRGDLHGDCRGGCRLGAQPSGLCTPRRLQNSSTSGRRCSYVRLPQFRGTYNSRSSTFRLSLTCLADRRVAAGNSLSWGTAVAAGGHLSVRASVPPSSLVSWPPGKWEVCRGEGQEGVVVLLLLELGLWPGDEWARSRLVAHRGVLGQGIHQVAQFACALGPC